jgi:hypothetical protein
VRRGEVEVALVLAGHSHDCPSAVAEQHVVRDVYRHRRFGEGVERVGAGEHTALLSGTFGGEPVNLTHPPGGFDELAHHGGAVGGGDGGNDRVLRGNNAEGHAKGGVGPGCVNPEGFDIHRLALCVHHIHLELDTLGTPDPVALLGDHTLGPVDG